MAVVVVVFFPRFFSISLLMMRCLKCNVVHIRLYVSFVEKNNIMKFINYKNDDDDENYLEKEIEKKRIVKRLIYNDERNE